MAFPHKVFLLGFLDNSSDFMFYSIGDIFPLVSLNFEGGASMVLKPEQYLMHNGYLVSIFIMSYSCIRKLWFEIVCC